MWFAISTWLIDNGHKFLESKIFAEDHEWLQSEYVPSSVKIAKKDWRATIRTEEDATGYSYPYFCFIGKIESEFKILLSL